MYVVLPSTRKLPNITASCDTVILLNNALPLYAARYAATLLLPYVAGNPLKNAPLPKIYAPEILAAVVIFAVVKIVTAALLAR